MICGPRLAHGGFRACSGIRHGTPAVEALTISAGPLRVWPARAVVTGRAGRFRGLGRFRWARGLGRLRWARGRLAERVLQLLLIQARGVERVTAATVRERQPRRLADVVHGHLAAAVPGRQRDRRARRHQVGAHAVHPEPAAHGADLPQRGVGQHDVRQPGARGGHIGRDPAGISGEAGRETGRVRLIGEPAADHLGALVRIAAGRYLDGQPEPVEQLRPQLAFLRIHRADEQEARGVPDRDPLPLDIADPERRRVEQQVDEMIVQQVDLVHVQQAAVRGGEHAGLVGGDALGQRALDVQRADEAVLGGAHGQLGERGRPGVLRATGRMRAVRAGGVGIGRVTGEPAAADDTDRGQQLAEAADDGGLRGAFLPAHQDPADRGRNRVEQQRELQIRHADDRGEGIQRSMRAGGHRVPLVAGGHVAGRHAGPSFPGLRARSRS